MRSCFNNRELRKLNLLLLLFFSLLTLFCTLKFLNPPSSNPCDLDPAVTQPLPHSSSSIVVRNNLLLNTSTSIPQPSPSGQTPAHHPSPPPPKATELRHIAFGIASSAKLWSHRKDYLRLWWRPGAMRGAAWVDSPVPDGDASLPPVKISGDVSRFNYSNRFGDRSGIRISRIVSETLRLGLEDVRWLVMGDDDTVFVPDNLVGVLRKYDHGQFYYVGSPSESHRQNIIFSYGMAYGGGGFAISYPLAAALEKMQDRCLERYPGLYGSDDRIQACMAELGVPLTREVGFHQYDVYGNLFGLLAAHPVAPLVSLHHLDVVEPIYPKMDRVQALQMLQAPMKLDSAGLLQQSICYDRFRSWTISVSWGYAVQILRGIIPPREMEKPATTFLHWYRRSDPDGFTFNTRPVSQNPCQAPFVYMLSDAHFDERKNTTVSRYVRHRVHEPACRWRMVSPARIQKVEVYKKPNPHLWDKSPRRNCCRILPSKKRNKMVIDVGVCREEEILDG